MCSSDLVARDSASARQPTQARSNIWAMSAPISASAGFAWPIVPDTTSCIVRVPATPADVTATPSGPIQSERIYSARRHMLRGEWPDKTFPEAPAAY